MSPINARIQSGIGENVNVYWNFHEPPTQVDLLTKKMTAFEEIKQSASIVRALENIDLSGLGKWTGHPRIISRSALKFMQTRCR